MDRFSEFYEALYHRSPFPWQNRLALRVGTGEWPAAIALPTAAGKTTCIDIAVFALACHAPNAARRIFFIVDRRIVVDQAYVHAESLAYQLNKAEAGILHEVAEALKGLTHDKRSALDAYALRGGMYRETAWVRSPLQPTIIASTVDQIGSRLLFRGYGVSESMMPIHAGLVGNDSLILLDEAHCAKPFDQTIRAVQKYRSWHDNKAPFRCVSITATPSVDGPVERDTEEDRNHPVLGKRLSAKKPTKLIVAEKAKGKNGQTELIKVLKAEAEELAKVHSCVGIVVNRVATARELAKALGEGTVLLTGRMRSLDRDNLFQDKLQSLLSDSNDTPPKFVVGTQCLECGADFDFHALVTECASLDALRQRFGRLNRIAKRDTAAATIFIRADETEDTSEDPVYGASLASTWKWLKSKLKDETVDFGITSMRELLDPESADVVAQLNAPTSNAPVLLPAYLDCWVQTHPIPEPDPDVALFLHGPVKPGQPDVQVVFRTDMGTDPRLWADVVALIPPSSSEAVAVPISVFRRWLKGEDFQDTTSDIEGEDTGEVDSKPREPREALEWKGLEKSQPVRGEDNVTPNGTYIVPTQATGWEMLGDFPYGLSDQAEAAFQRSRDKRVIRLPDFQLKEDHEEYVGMLTQRIEKVTQATVTTLNREWVIEPYPEPMVGVVATSKQRLRQFDPTILDEPDDSYRSSKAIALEQHCQGVASFARQFATGCGLDADLFEQAGLWHDLGKLDPRFQAMLRQMSPRTTVGTPLAKSERVPKTPAEREAARALHGYPKGARHELLSTAMLAAESDHDLLLHLVATHHGAARPFANPVDDGIAVPFKKPPVLHGKSFSCEDARQRIVDWNAELPERFWRMVNQYGWWGLAYQEAVFRLADHAQSNLESLDKPLSCHAIKPTALKISTSAKVQYEIELTGIKGTSPLGFMAAIGALRLISEVHPEARLSWCLHTSRPRLMFNEAIDQESLSKYLHKRLHREVDPAHMDDADHQFKEFRSHSKELQKAITAVKARNLKGIEREQAMEELLPLYSEVNESRNRWLGSLEKASPFPYMALGKSISVTQDEFFTNATRVVENLHEDRLRTRRDSDFLASFACDGCTDKNGKVIPTEFQFITGSGHQYFLETMSALSQQVTWEQIHQSVFEEWKSTDEGLSFRWDPVDDKRYAHKWEDPSSMGVTSEHGANILAANALPTFPVAPRLGNVRTTGFSKLNLGKALTWPLWSKPLSIASIRSLLQLRCLTRELPRETESLNIGMVMRAWKIQVGTPPLMKLNISNAFPV
ncbi:MAG TPA: type I-U CRISPR-associated helicase/endonuclease Cas3 [Gemmatales bacterium]|nr:type I-U CRISPR-associated helicase/endonuclease Cas3 [Gemmatales bacterium]